MISELVSGFTSSPVEVAIVIALMVIGTVALVVTARLKRKRERERLEREGEQTFLLLAEGRSLEESEIAQLRLLAEQLEEPHKRYMLRRNQALFDKAALLAQNSGEIDESSVSALRVRLGFAGSRAGVRPEATSELPEGGAVVVRAESGEGSGTTRRGRVASQTPEALCVGFDELPSEFDQGRDVTLFYFDDSGVYRARTRVVGSSADTVYLAHEEQLGRLQRRQFDRADVRLPVTIRSTRGEKSGSTSGELLDVGGGGARIRGPKNQFSKGSEVDISLHPDSETALRVSGTVVRRSHGGSVLHVAFDDLKESARDKLYQMVFSSEQTQAQR